MLKKSADMKITFHDQTFEFGMRANEFPQELGNHYRNLGLKLEIKFSPPDNAPFLHYTEILNETKNEWKIWLPK